MITVLAKLRNGETLLAELYEETAEEITLMRPLIYRAIPMKDKDGSYYEHPSISMYCQFVEDEHFTFKLTDVMFYKELVPSIGEFYQRLSDQLYSSTITHVNTDEELREELYSKQLTEEPDDFQQIMNDLKKNFH